MARITMETNEKGIILEDGHVYSDGRLLYVAVKQPPDSPNAWGLFRFDIEDGKPVKPTVPGRIAGFTQDRDGEWWFFTLGIPERTDQKLVGYSFENFEEKVLSKLKHEDADLLGFVANENFRDLMKGMEW
jgi:hypothetical protein